MPPRGLTPLGVQRVRQVWAWCSAQTQPFSVDDVRHAVGWRSTNTAHVVLTTLLDAGYLTWEPAKGRTMVVVLPLGTYERRNPNG